MNSSVRMVGWWLVVVSAVNQGLAALLNVNVINMILGFAPALERVFYILVGLSGLWLLYEKIGKKT